MPAQANRNTPAMATIIGEPKDLKYMRWASQVFAFSRNEKGSATASSSARVDCRLSTLSDEETSVFAAVLADLELWCLAYCISFSTNTLFSTTLRRLFCIV